MELQLKRVYSERRVILERFQQLLYEAGMDPGPDGLISHGESMDKFFGDPKCLPLFFVAAHQFVGFAMVKLDRKFPGSSAGDDLCQSHLIDGFYVHRRWRGQGIGTRAAHMLFDRYPGTWVTTTWPNESRTSFWRKATGRYERGTAQEYAPGEHKGFPGQCVWVVDPLAAP